MSQPPTSLERTVGSGRGPGWAGLRNPLPVCSGFRFLEHLCQFGSRHKRKARPSSKTARQEMHTKHAWADSLPGWNASPPPPRPRPHAEAPPTPALILRVSGGIQRSCFAFLVLGKLLSRLPWGRGQRAGVTGVHTFLHCRPGMSLAFVHSR